MNIARSVSDLIGDTSLLQVPTGDSNRPLFLKMEMENPSLSMKDRMALSMIVDAERNGRLKPGGVIIESSSGNTATALAMLAASRGYRFIAVVDGQISAEKEAALKAFGAQLHYVDGGSEDRAAPQRRRDFAAALTKEIPHSIYLNQADNAANPEGYRPLAREIASAITDVRCLIGAIGTGGSLCGTARALKESIPDVRVVAVEPKGSTIFEENGGRFFQTGTGRTLGTRMPCNIDKDVIDEHCTVTDREAFNAARFFAGRMGILLGGSAAGVAYKALERLHVQHGLPGATVALMPDSGEKYLATIFNDAWMEKHDLFDPAIAEKIQLLLKEHRSID